MASYFDFLYIELSSVPFKRSSHFFLKIDEELVNYIY